MVKFVSLRYHVWLISMVSRASDIHFPVDFAKLIPYYTGKNTGSPNYADTSKTKCYLLIEVNSLDFLLILIPDDLIRFGDGKKIQHLKADVLVHCGSLRSSSITSVGHLSTSGYILATPIFSY